MHMPVVAVVGVFHGQKLHAVFFGQSAKCEHGSFSEITQVEAAADVFLSWVRSNDEPVDGLSWRLLINELVGLLFVNGPSGPKRVRRAIFPAWSLFVDRFLLVNYIPNSTMWFRLLSRPISLAYYFTDKLVN
jgi:hypothetical protein